MYIARFSFISSLLLALALSSDVELSGQIQLVDSSGTPLTTDKLCNMGSYAQEKAKQAILNQLLSSDIATKYEFSNLNILICPQDEHDDLYQEKKDAAVVFPLLAAGSVVISFLFCRWRNKELEAKLALREKMQAASGNTV